MEIKDSQHENEKISNNEDKKVQDSEKEKELQKDELSILKEKLLEKSKEAKENYEKYIRTYADFDNYKKRVAREKEELLKYGNEKLILELLPVLDNLENTLEHCKSSNIESLAEGVRLTLDQFLKTLEKFGVKRFSALGENFDPLRHEAIDMIETDDEPGKVIKEMRKGYLFHDRLLRPAAVVVTVPKREQDQTDKEEGTE